MYDSDIMTGFVPNSNIIIDTKLVISLDGGKNRSRIDFHFMLMLFLQLSVHGFFLTDFADINEHEYPYDDHSISEISYYDGKEVIFDPFQLERIVSDEVFSPFEP